MHVPLMQHPRGAETSFIITGRLQFGMVQEDAKGNNLLFYNVSTNQSVHIPQVFYFLQQSGARSKLFAAGLSRHCQIYFFICKICNVCCIDQLTLALA